MLLDRAMSKAPDKDGEAIGVESSKEEARASKTWVPKLELGNQRKRGTDID
jgi:hypothetical protein